MKKIISAALLISLCFLTACGSSSSSSSDASSKSQSSASTSEATTEDSSSQKSGQVIYEDDNLKAEYLGVSDNAGYIMINMHFENKTDGELTVYPMDSSVNGVTVQYTSGMPATMQGGKVCNQSWAFNQDTVGIKTSSEVKSLQFKLNFGDTTTDNIDITVQ